MKYIILVSQLQRSPTAYFQTVVETIVDAFADLPPGLLKQKMVLVKVILVVLPSWQPLNIPCLLIGQAHINDIRGQGAAIGHQTPSDSSNNVYIMSQGRGKKSFLILSIFLIRNSSTNQNKPKLQPSRWNTVVVGFFLAGNKIKESQGLWAL